MVLRFYRKATELLKRHQSAVLMVVSAHSGSSPGRQGFHMLTTGKEMTGTIGGGIMEHKLVELSNSLLVKGPFDPFLKVQKHRSEEGHNRSGMICSGEQTVAFYYLDRQDLSWMQLLQSDLDYHIHYSVKRIDVLPGIIPGPDFVMELESAWSFKMPVQLQNEVYVIGAGHVGLAVSQVLSLLDFNIHLLDDRPGLNTMEENTFAHAKRLVDYATIDEHIPEGDNIFVVIISFGYRTDKQIIKRLLGKKYFYLGMMGSIRKIETLWRELLEEGFKQEELDRVVAPIGLDIKSETTHEIAISIAAQLIEWKNKKSI
ncbi:MAG: XdhC/CoxI family protein [Saprospirales bacterium]|nr:MAG: XdhC/CoxI family protein [Saprospirales bacterium]